MDGYPRVMRRNHAVAVLVAAALAGGCGDDGREMPSTPPAATDAVLAPDGKPVPEGCEKAVPADVVEAPRTLIVPAGPRLLVESAAVRPDDPDLTIVEGYLEGLPDDLVKAFEGVPRATVIFKESEGVDAEVLLSDRRSRNFWKIVRACAEGSRFTALVETGSGKGTIDSAVESQTKSGG